jgi:hypothetical protein
MINNDKIRTNLARNTDNSMIVVLRSSIGPNTRKVKSDPIENVLTKDEATKASAVEQSDSR